MKFLFINKNKKKIKKTTHLQMINDSSLMLALGESDNIIKYEEDKNIKLNKGLIIQYQMIINNSYDINNLDGNINIIESNISDIKKDKDMLFESEILLIENSIKKIIIKIYLLYEK